MNVISAQEVKRRGVVALQEAAKRGSVHILKNNRPIGVFLSEAEYKTLAGKQATSKTSLIDWMLNKPATGKETADSIEKRLRDEREAWD